MPSPWNQRTSPGRVTPGAPTCTLCPSRCSICGVPGFGGVCGGGGEGGRGCERGGRRGRSRLHHLCHPHADSGTQQQQRPTPARAPTRLALEADKRVQQADGQVAQQAVAAALEHGVPLGAQHDVQVAVLACSLRRRGRGGSGMEGRLAPSWWATAAACPQRRKHLNQCTHLQSRELFPLFSPSTIGSPSSKNVIVWPSGMPGSTDTVRASGSRTSCTLGQSSQTCGAARRRESGVGGQAEGPWRRGRANGTAASQASARASAASCSRQAHRHCKQHCTPSLCCPPAPHTVLPLYCLPPASCTAGTCRGPLAASPPWAGTCTCGSPPRA